MTTLRDDGYLETNDPVVGICFRGKTVLFVDEIAATTDILESVGEAFIGTVCKSATIRIPAATVAEVCGYGVDPSELTTKHIVAWAAIWNAVNQEIERDEAGALLRWLRKHTEVTDV